MEIVLKDVNELVTKDYVDLILQMEEIQTRLQVMDSAINEEMKNYLVDNNQSSVVVEKDGIKLKWTYVAPSITKKVDYERMKNDGIYEEYVKESTKKDFVRRTISYE